MMAEVSSASAANPSPPEAWSETARGVVSVLLVIHLVGLLLIFFANNEHADQRQSAAISRPKRLLNAYLYPLWFDRTWDHSLASGEPLDADHALYVTANSSDREPTGLRFPPPEASVETRERWQRLARLIAYLNDSDASQADALVLNLANGWRREILREQKAVGNLQVECRRRVRQAIDDRSPAPALDREEVVYVATVKWAANGEAFLTKPAADRRDVAPVVPLADGNSRPGTNALPLNPPAVNSGQLLPAIPAPFPPAELESP
jgi:hypothetical protein